MQEGQRIEDRRRGGWETVVGEKREGTCKWWNLDRQMWIRLWVEVSTRGWKAEGDKKQEVIRGM